MFRASRYLLSSGIPFGNFDHYFGVFFGGGNQVAQAEAGFQAFTSATAHTRQRVFFTADGTGGVTEKPIVYLAVDRHGFYPFLSVILVGKRS